MSSIYPSIDNPSDERTSKVMIQLIIAQRNTLRKNAEAHTSLSTSPTTLMSPLHSAQSLDRCFKARAAFITVTHALYLYIYRSAEANSGDCQGVFGIGVNTPTCSPQTAPASTAARFSRAAARNRRPAVSSTPGDSSSVTRSWSVINPAM